MAKRLTVQQRLRGALGKADDLPLSVQGQIEELVAAASLALDAMNQAAENIAAARDMVRSRYCDRKYILKRLLVALEYLVGFGNTGLVAGDVGVGMDGSMAHVGIEPKDEPKDDPKGGPDGWPGVGRDGAADFDGDADLGVGGDEWSGYHIAAEAACDDDIGLLDWV